MQIRLFCYKISDSCNHGCDNFYLDIMIDTCCGPLIMFEIVPFYVTWFWANRPPSRHGRPYNVTLGTLVVSPSRKPLSHVNVGNIHIPRTLRSSVRNHLLFLKLSSTYINVLSLWLDQQSGINSLLQLNLLKL